MNENDRTLTIRIDRKTGLLLLTAALLAWGGQALCEQLTMTTSYPVPSGVYNQLITTGNAGSTPADTTFSRNAGNTLLVPATNPGGRVGIGTASPQAKLDVVGQIRIAGGSPASGRVLTSDASGLATWSAPTPLNPRIYTAYRVAQASVRAVCGAGGMVMGGGCQVRENSSNEPIPVAMSYPDTPNSWRCEMPLAYTSGRNITTYAICTQ